MKAVRNACSTVEVVDLDEPTQQGLLIRVSARLLMGCRHARQ
jgi:hypothetical protein